MGYLLDIPITLPPTHNWWLKKETVLYRCYCIIVMNQIWPIRDLIRPPMSVKYVKINQIPSIFRKLNWNYPFKFHYKFLKPNSVPSRTHFPPMGLHFLTWDSVQYCIFPTLDAWVLKFHAICSDLRLRPYHPEIHSQTMSLMIIMSIMWYCWQSHAVSR